MSDPKTKIRSQFGPLVVILSSAIVLFFGVGLAWPPLWVERRQQRVKVFEKVRAAGGWDAVKRACLSLAETNSGFYWERRHDNSHPLPPTLATLDPVDISSISSETLRTSQYGNPSRQRTHGSVKKWSDFPSPEIPPGFNEKPEFTVARIKFFGRHATGGRSTPYYGIEIVTGPGKEIYQPQPVHAASGNGYTNFRKIEDGIYEVY